MEQNQNQFFDISQQPEIFTPNDTNRLPASVKRQIARDTALAVRKSVNMSANIKAQANIANTALSETANIVSSVTHLTELFPNGEKHFQHILNEYTMSVAERVRRFSTYE